ncbi:hypothetical protein DXV65_05905 [Pseudomonas fluorescens]|nr:hypothetical protein DXV65_05905 [Pseudomonas fluorescens]
MGRAAAPKPDPAVYLINPVGANGAATQPNAGQACSPQQRSHIATSGQTGLPHQGKQVATSEQAGRHKRAVSR